MAGLLSDDAIAAFERDGFVVIPDLLTDGELARFGTAVDTAVATRKRGDRRNLGEKTRYEQSFIQCINLWEDHAPVRPLTFHPRVARGAAELLRTPAVRLWHDQALYKEPGGRNTDPHQDQPYWPIAEPDTVTAWIPFDGSTAASGCMGYLPGSHATGVRKFVNIFGDTEPEDLLADPALAAIEPIFVEVPQGAVAFHHGLTVHLARANTSHAPRRVHTMTYFRDGCTRGSKMFHLSVDRAAIEVGEPIASDVTPIAWPRATGDLPSVPAPTSDVIRALAPAGLLPEPGPPPA